jgi:predicted kinase
MNWTLTKDRSWQALEGKFSWIADMANVPQDPRHHAEGDVATHTKMVLESLLNLRSYDALTAEWKEVMWVAAVLHDVEKRSTTVLESDGSITSRGHAKKGEFTARKLLFEMGAPFKMREIISSLVRLHGLPLWVMEKRDPQKAAISASLRVDTQKLSMLAQADVLGRKCLDQAELLDRIEFFDAYCGEQGCWAQPRNFGNGISRFEYFRKENSSPDYVPFDDYVNEVVMLCGLPGMGKDHYITKHYPGLAVVSLDDIRRANKIKPDDIAANGWVVQQAKELAKGFLRKREPFVWNATNVTMQMRSLWIDLFTTYKARIKLVYIEAPYNQWQSQNRERAYPVPDVVLNRLLQKLEVPLAYEAHEVIWSVS